MDTAAAQQLLARAHERLQQECDAKGRGAVLRAVAEHLRGTRKDVPPSPATEALRMNAQSLRVVLHRLRKRLREILAEDLAQAGTPAQALEAELERLLGSSADSGGSQPRPGC
jgi:hypothetical protein